MYPSPKAVEKLRLELSLLQILHHRNKNQHHLQPFFKNLSILKRTLAKLLVLGRSNSEYILERLRTVTGPKAWEEFSRVVARGEFVNLGVVLCACVGRIAYCLGGIVAAEEMIITTEVEASITQETDELGEVIMRKVVLEEEILEGEGFRDVGTDGDLVTPSQLTSSRVVDEDKSAKTTVATSFSETTMLSRTVESGLGDIEPPARKKRKRKMKDDIDELFARLK